MLPWKVNSAAGREELNNILNQIPTTANSLKYILYINNAAGDTGDYASAYEDASTTAVRVDDNIEELINRIHELEISLAEARTEIVQ